MTTIFRAASIAIASLTLAACGGGGGAGSSGGTDAPDPATASLSRVADCDALLAAVRDDARRKVAVQADGLRAGAWAALQTRAPAPVCSSTPAAAPTPAPQAGPPPDATDTNTQVPGVDEADVVETDGSRLYLLHDGRLLILAAVPPAESALVEEVTIEGYPFGLFVAAGRALVVSNVSDTGGLGGDSFCGASGEPFPPLDDPRNEGSTWIPPSCGSTFVKVTLLDVTTTPVRVVRELYVEGAYVAARRHGGRARIIVQRTWGTPVDLIDPWRSILLGGGPGSNAELIARVDAWEEHARAAIDASALADWIPAEVERVNGALVERPLTCDQAAVPPAGQASSGATLVVGLDLTTDDGPVADTLLLGSASQIYANADTLVLAQPEWQDVPLDGASTRTALHVFGLPADSLTPVYRGSGFVPGIVPSQFGLDVQGDVVRAATSVTDLAHRDATRVTTAHIVDDRLVQIGASADLAPGESLRGVRFLGDRAYLVTYLQVDPLFVVDLSDPTTPRALGALALPGFSEYLHPLDAAHVLTIGRAGDEQGRTLGVALRIFDVGDATTPRQTSEYVLPIAASTPAELDHLAFTFDGPRGLLALPVNSYDVVPRATLQLFAVDTATGITLRGTVDHGEVTVPPCTWSLCPGPDWMERGLFVGDAVYSISHTQVQVHTLDDLATTLATVRLP